MDLDGSIGVEFSDTRGCDLVPGLANVRWGQEELSREIRNLDWSRVIDCQALDSGQGNILRNLYTETLETNNEDVGGTHAAHGLVSQDIELSAVEGFVDVCGSNNRVVDLHSGRKIDLGKLGGLLKTKSGQLASHAKSRHAMSLLADNKEAASAIWKIRREQQLTAMVLLLSCRDSPSESLRFASAPELACDEILDMIIQHLGRARPHLDAADEVERELERGGLCEAG